MQEGARLVTQWDIVYTKQAQKDSKKIAAAGFKTKVKKLLDVVKGNPFKNPPPL